MHSGLALALLLTAAWTAGAPVQWLGSAEARSSVALRLTLGLGACATLVSALGLGGALQLAPWALAVLAVPAAFELRRARPTAWRDLRSPAALSSSGVALGLLVLTAALLAIGPIAEGDSLTYSMPILSRIVREHRLAYWPAQWRSALPLSHEVLASVILLLGGDRPGLLTGVEFLLGAALLVALGRRWLGNVDHARWGAAIALTGIAPLTLACSLKPDLLLLDASVACALVIDGVAPGDWQAAGLAGCFAGLMIACKYTGAPLAVAFLVHLAWRARAWSAIASALTGLVALGGYWYVKDWLVLGSPCPPFFPGMFPTGMSPAALAEFERHRAGFGAGRAALDLLVAPVRMFVAPESFGGRGSMVSPLAIVGIAAPLVPSLRRQAFFALSSFLALYFAWFIALQNARLLLPAWVLLGVLAAGVLGEVKARSRALGRAAICAAFAGVVLSVTVASVAVARALSHPSRYLASRTPFYDDIVWLNTHLDTDRDRVATVVLPLGYLRVPWIALDPYVESEIPPEDMTDAATLMASLARARVTHVYGPSDVLDGDLWAVVRRRSRVVHADDAACVCGTHWLRDDPHVATVVLALQEP